MDSGLTNSWTSATSGYIPLVLIEERNSGTFLMYGVNRGKIAVNIRITLNTVFNKMSTFFGNLKNSDSRQNVGLSFPPDGSIETFREKIDAIKKQLLTIPSLRKNLKPISVTIARYSYGPIAAIVEAALAKEKFPIMENSKNDAGWIQQQIANGNFNPTPALTTNHKETDVKRHSTRRSASRPAFVIPKRTVGFADGNHRATSKMNPAGVKKRIAEESKLVEEQLKELQREKLILETLARQSNKVENAEISKLQAQAMKWQNHLTSTINNPVIAEQNKIEGPRRALGVHKKERELRKLKLENGIGDYVRALQSLQQEHEELEEKIATLKQERQDMQQTIFNLSTGLSTYVTGLIKTDQVPFKNLDMTLFGLTDDTADQPEENQHRDPVGMAAEKLRARRIKLEERAASIASQVKSLRRSVAAFKTTSTEVEDEFNG